MKPKREPIPINSVVEWLAKNHPALIDCAEQDRNWLWLAWDGRGEHNKPIRESLKQFGFRFHFRGGHKLPSGKVGTWGHSCMKPTGFKRRKSGGNKTSNPDTKGGDKQELSDDELLNLLENGM